MSADTPPAGTPAGTPPPEPTPAQAAALAQASGAAAGPAIQRGATPDEVREIMRTEMANYRGANNVEITDDQIAKLANGTIEQLERMGAFETPQPPAGGDAAAAHAAAAAAAPPGVTPPAAPSDTTPRRESFADWFLGMGQRR